ncbi:type II secretion system F family protein [Leifsonia bigeumensis]|uniref:Type II secretion system F family protein n=1 Tax=Leifsonella bigeumensis TaxID=433643 RepID=A0ABP7FVX2_9MICO
MILLLGCSLGLGLLLTASPFLWPAARRALRSTPGVVGRLQERMRQAGLRAVSVPTFAIVSLIVGAVTTAAVFVFVPVVALAVAAGLVALALPTAVVNWRARAGRRANRVVWPDVVDHLVSAVRSGLSLPDGVALLAHNGPAPTREAFAEFESDFTASGNFARSLDRVKERLGDPVADRILETLRMSREVGGNELPAVLRALAAHLRQEAAIRGEVEARQSWVMNAARLGAAAPWVILALLATRPEAAAAYNTSVGIAVIVGGLVVTVVAYRAMIALARLPEERRWFR